MARRRKKYRPSETRLTPEGWVYLIVLVFITVGSVLRNVNLLILMAGMMYAPLFLNWRLGIRRLKLLDAFRRFPQQVHANELTRFFWTCENQMSGMAAWNLVIHDRIEKVASGGEADGEILPTAGHQPEMGLSRLPWGKRKRSRPVSEVKVGFVVVAANQTAVQSYRVFFGQRGKYFVGPASLTTTFPFGLILSRRHFPAQETIFVGPEIGRLDPVWEQRVQSVAMGSESIKRQRSLEEDEFYALRPWRSGDSKKNIHWRTTAKMGQPIIKQHDQQNNRDFALMLDLLVDNDVPESAERCELALAFAATALLRIGNAVHGQVAIGVCGEESSLFHSRTHSGVISDAMQHFAVTLFSSDPDISQLVETLFQTTAKVSPGTPTYIVSSREMPDAFKLEHLLAIEQNASQREEARVARKLRLVLPSIRWLVVASDEFNRVFSLQERSTDESSLKELSARWGDPC